MSEFTTVETTNTLGREEVCVKHQPSGIVRSYQNRGNGWCGLIFRQTNEGEATSRIGLPPEGYAEKFDQVMRENGYDLAEGDTE